MKNLYILFILFFASVSFLYCQTDSPNKNVETPVVKQEKGGNYDVFTVVEENPQFPDGDEARMVFLQKNIKYPKSARKKGVQGVVYVTFIVEKDGSLSNIKILRGIHPDCDNEVIRVVKLFPKWIPGKQKGKTVRVQFNMPVKFMLTED